jgi:error-prone DNA polymerase
MAEYGATGVSAQGHLMELYRERAEAAGAIASEELTAIPAGRRVRVAGMVAVRQRPPTAKGFVFVTLEDEGGTMNVIIKPPIFERQHQVWSRGLVLLVEGTVEREGAFCNVMAQRAWRLA